MKSAAVRCSAGSTRPTPPTTPLTPLWRSPPGSAACRELASRLAQTDVTVLLQSESGTGKELYAQAIHNASPRSAGVFVAINCANFNANMLESELFGYTEGAFTGAKRGGNIRPL